MKKKMKKSFIIPLIAIVALIVIVGVGYAAWTILSPINVEGVNGNIETEELIDKTFKIEVKDKNNIPSIVFGAPNNFSTKDAPIDQWFSNDSKGTAESLTATITIVLTPTKWVAEEEIDYYLQSRSINVNLGINDSEEKGTAIDKFDEAVENGYIAYPTINGATVESDKTWKQSGAISTILTTENFTKHDDTQTYTAEITITFGWGTQTNSLNPYVFYNQKNDDGYCVNGYEENFENAAAMMNAIYGLNKTIYKVQFEAVNE